MKKLDHTDFIGATIEGYKDAFDEKGDYFEVLTSRGSIRVYSPDSGQQIQFILHNDSDLGIDDENKFFGSAIEFLEYEEDPESGDLLLKITTEKGILWLCTDGSKATFSAISFEDLTEELDKIQAQTE